MIARTTTTCNYSSPNAYSHLAYWRPGYEYFAINRENPTSDRGRYQPMEGPCWAGLTPLRGGHPQASTNPKRETLIFT